MIKTNWIIVISMATMMMAETAYSAKPTGDGGGGGPVIEDTAERIELRKNCTVNGKDLDNCFTNTLALTDWLGTRSPNETSPLFVDVGPGLFETMILDCTGNAFSHITVRGSGRGVSTFFGNFSGISVVGGCKEMSFENLTAKGAVGVFWFNDGNSTWLNVEMDGAAYGWYDAIDGSGSPCNNPGRHNIFSSTVTATEDGIAFRNACGKVWLFGSEITTNIASDVVPVQNGIGAIKSVGAANELHVYGGNIRVINESATANSNTEVVYATDGASVHIHGTGVDASNVSASSVVVLSADSGATIHANVTAYNIDAGVGGSIERIKNVGGHVSSPFIWNVAAQPPVISSVTGADMVVVTDTDDAQPHLLIYSNNCVSKWYDTVNKVCH